MEKNNLSRVLIGLCIAGLIGAGFSIWKMDEKIKKNNADNQALRTALSVKTKEISKLSEKKLNVPEEMGEILSNTQSELNKIEHDRGTKKTKRAKPLAAVASGAWIEELKSELMELNKQEQELMSVLTEEKQVFHPISEDLEEIEKHYDDLIKDDADEELISRITELENRLIKKEEKLEENFETLEEISAEKEVLQLHYDELRKQVEIAGAESQSKEQKAKIAKLTKEIKELKSKGKDLGETVSKMSKENQRLKDMAYSSDSQQQKELKKQVDELTAELDNIKSGKLELISQIEVMNEDFQELEKSKETQAADIKRLESELAVSAKTANKDLTQMDLIDSKEKLEKITELYSRLKEQLKEVAVILSKRDELIIKREQQLVILQDEKEYLKQKAKSLDEFFSQFKDYQAKTIDKLNDIDDSLADERKQVDVILNSSTFQQ